MISFCAILKYSLLISMPMNLRLSFAQAMPVVPMPMKGSRTMSFSKLQYLIIHSISGSGFCVGCKCLKDTECMK